MKICGVGMKRKEKSFSTLYEDDLIEFLEKNNLLLPIRNGEIICIVCKRKITFNNIGGFIKAENNIKIVCIEPSCFSQAIFFKKKYAMAG